MYRVKGSSSPSPVHANRELLVLFEPSSYARAKRALLDTVPITSLLGIAQLWGQYGSICRYLYEVGVMDCRCRLVAHVGLNARYLKQAGEWMQSGLPVLAQASYWRIHHTPYIYPNTITDLIYSTEH